MGRPRQNKERDAAIVAMVESGRKIRDVAGCFGLSDTSIRNIVARVQWERRCGPRPTTTWYRANILTYTVEAFEVLKMEGGKVEYIAAHGGTITVPIGTGENNHTWHRTRAEAFERFVPRAQQLRDAARERLHEAEARFAGIMASLAAAQEGE